MVLAVARGDLTSTLGSLDANRAIVLKNSA
jgi:hypothetical protein